MIHSLYRIVYCSRNRIGGGPDSMLPEIRTILDASMRNNAPVGITGALMFNAGCFAQVLEGRREVLESTFERIQQDDRHGDVSLLTFEAIEVRTFGEWSMGFFGQRDGAAFAEVAASSGFDPSRADGDQVVDALKRLAFEDEAVFG